MHLAPGDSSGLGATSNAGREQDGCRAWETPAGGAAADYKGRHEHGDRGRGRTLDCACRTDCAVYRSVDERRPPGGAGFFRRRGTWERLVRTPPLAAERFGDDAGVRRCRTRPADGCVQESVLGLGHQNRAGVTHRRGLYQLAALFEPSTHDREVVGIRCAPDRQRKRHGFDGRTGNGGPGIADSRLQRQRSSGCSGHERTRG